MYRHKGVSLFVHPSVIIYLLMFTRSRMSLSHLSTLINGFLLGCTVQRIYSIKLKAIREKFLRNRSRDLNNCQ